MKILASKQSIRKYQNQTLTPPGKQKAVKSLGRTANFLPGGYLKSICRYQKEEKKDNQPIS